jgi:drug/metabolite transporter (DMT)-like permease
LSAKLNKTRVLAVCGLVTGALVWGLIWYPYRVLEQAGVGGAFATLVTYAVALGIGFVAFARELRGAPRSWLLAWIAIAAGWTNLAYVLAVIEGEVMRVMLLFYLAPLWTVVFVRILLRERMGNVGALVVLLSVGGAATMLYEPAGGLPLPANRAEWMGLSAGLMFALSNVLARKAHEHSVAMKSVAIWFGVTVVCVIYGAGQAGFLPGAQALAPATLGLMVLVGVVLFALSLIVQYGIAHTAANQAIVIMLLELVFAAIAAYYLAGEAMQAREWVGGAMIVAASLFSGKLTEHPPG